MIYHSEADVAALYVDAHSGVRAHNVLIELVALTVIVLPEILVSGRMIVARDVEVNVALLEQRQNEAAQVGLSVELVITLVAHQNREVADDDAVLGCAELLALDDLFEPFSLFLALLVEGSQPEVLGIATHLVLSAIQHDDLQIAPA